MMFSARRVQRSFKTHMMVFLLLLMLLVMPTDYSNDSILSIDTYSPNNSPIAHSREVAVSPDVALKLNTLSIDMDLVDYTVVDSPESFDGYTLFNFYDSNGLENILIIMDMDGNIVAQKDIGVQVGWLCPAEFIDPNTILTGSQWGAALWHLGNDTLQPLGIAGHHEYEYNPNDNTILTLTWNVLEIDGIVYRFDYVSEYTMNGTLIWQLDTHDFISEEWWCPFHDMTGPNRDLTHSNTIFYDVEEDMIYLNTRNPNTFFKIDHSTGDVLWGLGEYGNFTMYDIEGNPTDHLFFHAHSVEKLNENTFIIFDNDYHNQISSSRRSRILEIEVNESTMIAREVWSYRAPSAYYSMGWGDADRLPNGNRIGCYGYPATTSSGFSAVFSEVNPQGEIVWEARFMYSLPSIYGAYRLERFRFAPILSSPADMIGLTQGGNVTWDVWFNYRNKEPLPGNYTLYINDAVTKTGNFTYAKFWNPTSLVMPYENLAEGIHNMTLVVSDEYGHISTDTVMLTTQKHVISRSGYTLLEKGQQSSLPTWSGLTTSLLTGNITLNGTLHLSLNWTGQDIVLDPDLIALGSHFVEFKLYNGTLLVHNETFWIQVTPSAPPDIVPLQPSQVYNYWSQTLVLSWELYDVTAHSWSLLLNGTETVGGMWSPTSYRIDWELPNFDIGTYNITVVAYDDIGHVSTSECLVIVSGPTSPYILSSPGNSTIIWGSEGISFHWEVIGGSEWLILRNGEFLDGDAAIDYEIDFPINDWRTEGWKPGIYNLTLVYILGNQFTTDTIWVEIVVDPGDPYVDAFLPDMSQSYISGQNAVDAPDEHYTILFSEYADGYISLDMGENEEIVDAPGDDFIVVARGGDYRVSVSNSLDIVFKLLGTGSGEMSFDLADASLNEARYVRVQYVLGENTELDAIIALNYNRPPVDDSPPEIEEIDDFWIWLNEDVTKLRWSAEDATPWSLEIYIDSVLVVEDFWNGSIVVFDFVPETIGLRNVTLVLYDAFGNMAADDVQIYVRSSMGVIVVPLILGGTGATLVAFVLLVRRRYTN